MPSKARASLLFRTHRPHQALAEIAALLESEFGGTIWDVDGDTHRVSVTVRVPVSFQPARPGRGGHPSAL
jgi:hypothetical protein